MLTVVSPPTVPELNANCYGFAIVNRSQNFWGLLTYWTHLWDANRHTLHRMFCTSNRLLCANRVFQCSEFGSVFQCIQWIGSLLPTVCSYDAIGVSIESADKWWALETQSWITIGDGMRWPACAKYSFISRIVLFADFLSIAFFSSFLFNF